MNKQTSIVLALLASALLLGFAHSVCTFAGFLLTASGIACYAWDRNSKTKNVRISAFANNSALIIGGVILTLISILTLGGGNGRSPEGIWDFFWVVTYSFSITITPLILWYHFSNRRYLIEKAKCNRYVERSQTPMQAYFEQRMPSNCQACAKGNSRNKNSEKQFKLAV